LLNRKREVWETLSEGTDDRPKRYHGWRYTGWQALTLNERWVDQMIKGRKVSAVEAGLDPLASNLSIRRWFLGVRGNPGPAALLIRLTYGSV
jgi:hypothetical protein